MEIISLLKLKIACSIVYLSTKIANFNYKLVILAGF